MDKTKQLCEDILNLLKKYEDETDMCVSKIGLEKTYHQAFSWEPLNQVVHSVSVEVKPKIK